MSDAEYKAFFDEALADPDGTAPSSDAPDDDEFDDEEDDSEESDDADDTGDDDDEDPSDDADDDEEYDDAADDEDDEEEDGEETPAERRAREAEEALDKLQRDRLAEQREIAGTLKAVAVRDAFLKHKASLDAADEQAGDPPGTRWRQFADKFNAGLKDFVIANQGDQLKMLHQMVTTAQTAESENAAFKVVYEHFDKQFKFNDTERLALELTQNPDQFEVVLNRIAEDRRKRTEPMRQAKRAKRQQAGADRTGVRGAGGSTSTKATKGAYDNYDPAKIEEYLADVFA